MEKKEKIIIRKNSEFFRDKAFNRLYNLQSLLKKESALKELCKINFSNIFLNNLFRYQYKR